MFEATIGKDWWYESIDDFIDKLEIYIDQNNALKTKLDSLDPYRRLKCIIFNIVDKDFKGSIYEELDVEIKDLDFKSIVSIAMYAGFDLHIATYAVFDLHGDNTKIFKNYAIISNMLSKWHIWKRLDTNSDSVLNKTEEYVFNKFTFIDELGYPIF